MHSRIFFIPLVRNFPKKNKTSKKHEFRAAYKYMCREAVEQANKVCDAGDRLQSVWEPLYPREGNFSLEFIEMRAGRWITIVNTVQRGGRER